MKTMIALVFLVATSNAFASDCSIKVYSKGKLIRETQPILFDRTDADSTPACYELVDRIMTGRYRAELGADIDAIEFSYVNRAGATIKGSLQK